MHTILEQENEERQWDLYCAIAANPFAEDVGNFEDFKRSFRNTSPNGKKETDQTEMNETRINLQVEEADKILKGFTPPQKGGS